MNRRSFGALALASLSDCMTYSLGRKDLVSLPFGNAFWADVGWWDLRKLVGNSGDAVSTDVPSLVGSNVLSPQGAAGGPLIDDLAEYGYRGVVVKDTPGLYQYFFCPAALPLLNGLGQDCCFVMKFRQNRVAEIPLWTACQAGPTPDRVGARSVNERACLRKYSNGGQAVTAIGTLPLAYEDHTYVWTFNATTRVWTQYIDGAVDPITNNTLNADSVTLQVFSLLGSYSTAVFEGASGFCGLFAAAAHCPSQAQVLGTLYPYLNTQSYILPASNTSVPEFITAGASIMAGTTDEVTGGGYRVAFGQQGVPSPPPPGQMFRRLSLAAKGVNQTGIFPNRATGSISGASAAQIAAQVTSQLTSRTAFVVVDLGNNEINSHFSAPQVEAAVNDALTTIRTAIQSTCPTCEVIVSTIMPYFESDFNAVAIQVNAAYPALWDAQDAAFPSQPKMLRWDANAAMLGPVYHPELYSTPTDNHPNNAGYTLCAAAVLQATNVTGLTLLQYMQIVSPT